MKYSALSYANQWFMIDRNFMNELGKKNNTREIDAAVLGKLAAKYMVARGFKTEENDPPQSDTRWVKAAEHLTAAVQSTECAGDKVCALAHELGEVAPVNKNIKAYLLSAATKFLWFAGEHEVRILDRRAVNALGFLGGNRGKLGVNYRQYAEAWGAQFVGHKEALKGACSTLPCQLEWTCIPSHVHCEAKAAFKETWFADRVFDKYLWTLGAGATSFVQVDAQRLDVRAP